MLKIDYIVFICFLIILEISKPENSSLFSFLKKKTQKKQTMCDHLIVRK